MNSKKAGKINTASSSQKLGINTNLSQSTKILSRIGGQYSATNYRQPKILGHKAQNQVQQQIACESSKTPANNSPKKNLKNVQPSCTQTYRNTPMQRSPCKNRNKTPILSNTQSTMQIKSVDFEKQQQRSRDNIFYEWRYNQNMGKWEQKRLIDKSPQKYVLESYKAGLEEKLNTSVQMKIKERTNSSRHRDFTSQISTLPGPQMSNKRECQESSLTPDPRPIHPLNVKIQEAFYFNLGKSQKVYNKENINTESMYKSYEKKCEEFKGQQNQKKNKYELSQFIYRTPRDFLTCDQQK